MIHVASIVREFKSKNLSHVFNILHPSPFLSYLAPISPSFFFIPFFPFRLSTVLSLSLLSFSLSLFLLSFSLSFSLSHFLSFSHSLSLNLPLFLSLSLFLSISLSFSLTLSLFVPFPILPHPPAFSYLQAAVPPKVAVIDIATFRILALVRNIIWRKI